ncbi:MAG: hypothetical protein HRT58_22570 [Crocinitomicaceae bacterium]|nr:hypothetical protein [Flavobacteriales bacterium]NQZ38463.1 hypothetical protein [Crocinitomicaceae bacterium]
MKATVTIIALTFCHFSFSQNAIRTFPDSSIWNKVEIQDTTVIDSLIFFASKEDKSLILYSHDYFNVNSFRFTERIINDTSFINLIKTDYKAFQIDISDTRQLKSSNWFYDSLFRRRVKTFGTLFQYCIGKQFQIFGAVPVLFVFDENGQLVQTVTEMDAKRLRYNFEAILEKD